MGLACRKIFEKTRIPEAILLMLVGFLLGPGGLISYFGLPRIDPQYFQEATPVVGAVVIIFLVFDAGFRLKAREIFGSFSFATAFALANIIACMLVLTALLFYGLGWGITSSLLLAAILCGPSTYAIYSILPLVRASNYTRNVLQLEGVLSTIIVCIIAIALLRYGEGSGSEPGKLLQLVASSFSVSAILGLALGLALLWAMQAFKVKRFGYLLTLSALLVLYFTDFTLLGGIGVISVAVIGFVLGNSQEIIGLFGKPAAFEIEESFSSLQSEMGIFVSTFFFVYLGMVFRPWELNAANVGLALLLVGGMLLSRVLVILCAKALGHSQHKEDVLLAAMVPSDLLSATLATLIFVYPGIASFSIELVLLVIAATSLFTSLGVGYYERLIRSAYLFRREVRLSDGRKVIVRTFTKDDVHNVGKFLNEMVREGALIALDQKVSPSEEKEMGLQSIRRINKGEMIMCVGEHSGRIIARGVAEKMQLRERDNVSLSFYVASDFRGLGLGSALLRMLVDEAKRTFRPHNLYLTVYSDNERAMKLYRREGFVKVGVLPGWMKHKGRYLDRVYMIYHGKKK
ncbi:Sodium/hydrogen exchanger family protein [uncultured archaeon]|nr:Sodium/hydrogen exchanger family protein [uncultured archaeon]